MIPFLFVSVRVALGLLFIVSGGEKALGHYQNFLYVLEGYEVFPDFLEEVIARVFPWVELMLGLFLLAGLWLKWTLRSLALLSFLLILVVAQALIRNLPLDNCGCFGQLIHLPLHGVIMLDVFIFMLSLLSLKNLDAAGCWGLDRYYSGEKS